jgi:tripartite-type tricarboxylate transporter receptor subunit TctC
MRDPVEADMEDALDVFRHDRHYEGTVMRRVGLCSRAIAAFASLTMGSISSSARAQDHVADFYKGRTITIVVGSSPGGGYDMYGRLIARFLSRHMPGDPQVVVQNMPGAASNVAAGYVYNVAPKDGTVLGAIFMGAVVDPLFGDVKRMTHDTQKFNYIGNANSDAYVCLIRSDAPIKSPADIFNTELVMGASAGGASTRDFPMLLKNVLGAKFKIVAGYPGTREINLALEKGEVQGACGETWSSVAATYPYWFKDNLVRPLIQEGNVGYPQLDAMGVPLTRDFAKSVEQRQILELVYSQTTFGRPYVVAPGVPEDRVAALRKAFMETLKDPELVAEADRMQLDVSPISGEELQKIIAKVYATPSDVVQKAKDAMAFKP